MSSAKNTATAISGFLPTEIVLGAEASLFFRKAAREAVALVPLASVLAMLGSCTANFSTLVADHLECAADAGIARSQVEQCLGYGNVHRDAFDMCLERQRVAQGKIELLDDCVAAPAG